MIDLELQQQHQQYMRSEQARRQVFRKLVYVLMSRFGKKNGTVEFLSMGGFKTMSNSIELRPFQETKMILMNKEN